MARENEKHKQLRRNNAAAIRANARALALSFEDPTPYKKWAQTVYDDLEPEGAIELMLVNQIINNIVRLHRMNGAERANLETNILKAAEIRTITEPDFLNSRSVDELDQIKQHFEMGKTPVFNPPPKFNIEAADVEKSLQRAVDAHHTNSYERINRRRNALVRDLLHDTKAIRKLQNRRLKKS